MLDVSNTIYDGRIICTHRGGTLCNRGIKQMMVTQSKAIEALLSKTEKKKPTNFEIITKSPESLAEFIGSVLDCCNDECGECKHCPLGKNCNAIKDFKQIALEWLKQESE